MSKVFILFLFVKIGYGGGLTSAEFATIEQCEAALKTAKETLPLRAYVYGFCTDNGGNDE